MDMDGVHNLVTESNQNVTIYQCQFEGFGALYLKNRGPIALTVICEQSLLTTMGWSTTLRPACLRVIFGIFITLHIHILSLLLRLLWEP